MVIDNSMANAFRKCPRLYQWRYERSLERDWSAKLAVRPLDFGNRVHQLLEEHYRTLKGDPIPPYPESDNAALEMEAQALFARYLNAYPVEPFSVLDVERTFKVPLDSHTYVGKFDVIGRENDTGALFVMDHKTEKRTSPRNRPEAWAARSQASLYLWAAWMLHREMPRHLLLNVLRRQSDKGQVGPEFPPRQTVQRTWDQINLALRDLTIIADCIEDYRINFEDAPWPMHTENCMDGNFQCDYYQLCHYGESEEILAQFVPTTPYLDL